jgi:ATP-dependent Clp protease ATP-binding subunit ClpC
MGAGSAQGSLDASNMLKPALARGTFQCIGATTLEEYRKSIEKDGALERRFQKVVVDPTTVEETIEILKVLKDRYEDHHMVEYTPEAIEACVILTDKYMNDRFMPDKAIDALDEAGAKIHVDFNSADKMPKNFKVLEEKIRTIKLEKTDCVKEQDFEKAASWRDKERNLTETLIKEKTKWESNLNQNREIVEKSDVAEVISMMTKIPVDAVDADESDKLKKLGTKMKNIIIGQDDAVDKVVRSIKRSRIGIKDPKKPVGTFMFLGSTGVGKTYLAKVLAKELFGSEEKLIRIDMSEYMEKHAVSKLIGAPPGYVGYDDGGELTEAVRRNPYSIILLDEMEKAHPDVFNILLQVLDDGILTDSFGRRVNFKNTIIIMTSNTGSRRLNDFGTGMGFSTKATKTDIQSKRNAVIDKELKKSFAPEFLNRVDELVMFNSLSKDNILKIIELELKESLGRLKEIGYNVNITDSLKDFIFQEGWDADYGARPLKRAIQRYIEDALTDAILDGDIVVGDRVSVRYKNKEVTIKVLNKKELPPSASTKLLEA